MRRAARSLWERAKTLGETEGLDTKQYTLMYAAMLSYISWIVPSPAAMEKELRETEARCVRGADVVLHSVTKFLNGHADIVGGIIVAETKELYKRIRSLMINFGCNMDPHQAFLVHRGLKTLSLRVMRAQKNAEVGIPSTPRAGIPKPSRMGSAGMLTPVWLPISPAAEEKPPAPQSVIAV